MPEAHRAAPMALAALVAATLAAAPAPAQLSLSGSLDLGYKQDFARERGEQGSRINDSIKGQSPFSLVRSRLFADAELGGDISVFTTVLFDEGVGHFDMEGAYVVLSRLGGRPSLNLEVGKMATPFGRWSSRSFASVNPLIGTPLIYHYFSAVQGHRVPRDAAQQLAWRDAPYAARGLPTIYDACWNTGVQLFGSTPLLAYSVALTKGAVSNPRAWSNDGAQLVGRVGFQPSLGLQLGLSGAWGPYLEESAALDAAFPAGRQVEEFRQLLFGADMSYSVWHCELTAEVVRNRWDVPHLEEGRLANTGGYAEAAIMLRPGLTWALRVGQILYDEIDDGAGGQVAWDYDIRRVETGLVHYLTRHVHLKGVVQLNDRHQAAPDDRDYLFGFQLSSVY